MTCSELAFRAETRGLDGKRDAAEGARLSGPFYPRLAVASVLTAAPHFRAQHLNEPPAESFLATSGICIFSACTGGPRTIM